MSSRGIEKTLQFEHLSKSYKFWRAGMRLLSGLF